ncbi:MAG: nucleoside hydrolase [bacterium]|nr:nucleoside hydrolase [bacterium]
MTHARKVILDCDPGHDDALAILLAAGNPAIDLLAITTVGGNQTAAKVARNALAVSGIAGLSVPVSAGCQRPMIRELSVAPEIHGDTGLDGPPLPEPRGELDPRHSVDLLIETVMAHEPGEVAIVATGPLSNLALAVRKEPRLTEWVSEVVLMGGSYSRGNWTPAAEFNIWVDAEAAEMVFSAGWQKLTEVGLDVTHQALATPEVRERIRGIGSELSRYVDELLDYFTLSNADHQGFEFPPVHDPVCVAALIDPSVIGTREAFVGVETRGRWTYGMTVTDFDGQLGEAPNAQVAVSLDHGRFWDLVIEGIAALPR